jgi:hypothetical protein
LKAAAHIQLAAVLGHRTASLSLALALLVAESGPALPGRNRELRSDVKTRDTGMRVPAAQLEAQLLQSDAQAAVGGKVVVASNVERYLVRLVTKDAYDGSRKPWLVGPPQW